MCGCIFGKQKVDVFLLTTWITAFQVIIGFMLAPLNSLLPTTEGGMPLAEIGTQFKRGDCQPPYTHPHCLVATTPAATDTASPLVPRPCQASSVCLASTVLCATYQAAVPSSRLAPVVCPGRTATGAVMLE